MQWFMEGGAMPKLLQLMYDQDAVCRAKALLALSCLIRQSPLALEVFKQKQGVAKLVEAASDSDVKVQRWAHRPRLHRFCPCFGASKYPTDTGSTCKTQGRHTQAVPPSKGISWNVGGMAKPLLAWLGLIRPACWL